MKLALTKKWLGIVAVVALVGLACGGAAATATPVRSPTPEPQPAGMFQWEFFDVGRGAKPALALDSQEAPGIAYLLEDNKHGFVKYASWKGDGFDISNVADGYFYGPVDLDFGPDDEPHISWHDHQNPDSFVPELGDAVYATLVDGEWEVETVFSVGHDGWDNSITVDSQGNIHMTAIDPRQFGSMQGIEYYFFDGQEWTVEAVGSVPLNYEWGNSLALDSSGRPHITFHDSVSTDLFYALRGEDGWTIHTVDSLGDVGKFSSLALNNEDLPLISYLEFSGPVSGTASGFVKLAKLTSHPATAENWDIEQIDRLDNLFMGHFGARLITALVTDKDKNPIVVYSDQSVIKLAYFDGSEWHIELVANSNELPFGQLVSLARDSNGVLHLAYTELEKREPPGIVGTVKYARGTPIQ